jgi:hypothetical protein
MKYLETKISLPAGLLPPEQVRTLLQRIFEDYRWFTPKRYGFAAHDYILPSGSSGYEALLEYYSGGMHALNIAAQTDKDYLILFPAKPGMRPHVGKLVWGTSVRAATRSSSWRSTHVQQLRELMDLLDSPLAMAAMEEDFEGKTKYLIDHGTHREQAMTVRGYGEGLAGLFWRNFYGPLFVRLFGEQLNALPPECVTRLGEELVLVQPYELPTAAGTEAARAREQQLISLLGPECFYDHEHHRPPSRRPVLPPPIAPWTLHKLTI